MELVNFNLYKEDFTWDYTMHFPVPTISYVLRRTGINITDRYDTTEEAKGHLVAFTRVAKNYIFNNVLIKDARITEYVIAHNKTFIYEALEFICEVIKTAFISGDFEKLYKAGDRIPRIPALESAYNSLSFTVRFINVIVPEFYVGY